MPKTRRWLRELEVRFRRVAYTLPPSSRRTYEEILGWGKTGLAVLSRPALHFYTFPSVGGCRIGYLGPGTSLRFLVHLLQRLETLPQSRDSLPWWRVRSALPHLQEQCDLFILEMPYRLLEALGFSQSPSSGILTTPWMRWYIPLEHPWDVIEAGFHRSARDDLRWAKGLTCTPSRQPEDLAFFYHTFYRPYLLERFGSLAEASSFEELRYFFRYGWLVWARDGEGNLLGALLCFAVGRAFYAYVLALKPGLPRRITKATMAAWFAYLIRWAWQQGFAVLDLGFTRPLLNDGVVRYKRKWGARIAFDPLQTWGWWITTPHGADGLRSLFARTPWIWRGERGRLYGLLLDPELPSKGLERLPRLGRAWWVPGLSGLLIYPGQMDALPPSAYNPLSPLGKAILWHP